MFDSHLVHIYIYQFFLLVQLSGPYIGHFSHMATQMQRLNPLSVLQVWIL